MTTETGQPATAAAPLAPPGTELPPATPQKLWNKNYLLLWQGQFVSRVGNQLFDIALTLWVLQLTGSATLMGLLLMVSSIPQLILTPLGGVIADRFSRRKTIILCDLLSGLAVLSLAALAYFLPDAVTLQIAWLFVVSVLLSIFSSFFGPSIAAAVPDLVPRERLAGAYSMGSLSAQISVFLGQGLGATIFRLLGAPVMFFVNGLSFVFSSTSMLFVAIPQHIPETSTSWRERMVAFRADLALAFRFIWASPGLRAMVLITAFGSFFTAPMLLLFPFYVQEYLKAPVDWYGWILAASGVGALVGYVVTGITQPSGRWRALTMLLMMFLDAGCYALLVATQVPLVALLLAMLNGAASAFVTVNITTLVQMTTPTVMRGRVSGLLSTIAGSITPIAFGLSGILADLTGRNIPLIYLTCSAILFTLTLIIVLNPAIRQFLATTATSPPTDTAPAPAPASARPTPAPARRARWLLPALLVGMLLGAGLATWLDARSTFERLLNPPAATVEPSTITQPAPTIAPTTIPTTLPTTVPTLLPTALPAVVPTSGATAVPTNTPVATPTRALTATPAFIEYTVQPGDILYRIARQYNVSVEELIQINALKNPESLTIGQVLKIPRK